MHKLPPPVEWTFATPAITSGYGAKADWAYYVTETSDKGILTAGFVEDGSPNRKPVLYKYDPFKKATLWENVMLPGSQTSGLLGGALYDAFEFDDGNGNAYYAVGSRSTATSILRLVVAKVHPEDGTSFSGYPKIIEMDAGDSIRCRGYAMMPIINDNEFVLIPASHEPDAPAKSYGVRFDGTSAYKISGNTFEAANVDSSTYGVIVDNTGALPSEISGNTFKLRIGNQTQNNNKGLQIRCNIYQSSTYAWAINPESDTNGFLADQGECGEIARQAGNIFTVTDCPDGEDGSHIFSTIEFEYRYRPTGDEIPTCVSMVVDTQNCDIFINEFTCPMELPCHPCDKDELKDLVEEAASADERKRYLIELLRYLVVTDSIGEAAEIIVDEAVTDSVDFSKLAVKALISAGEYEDAETELGKMSPTDTTFHDLYGMLITIALEDTLTILDIKPEDETMLEDIGHGD